MQIKRLISLLLALVLLFCMIGCAEQEQPPVTPPGGDETPPEGDPPVNKKLTITGPTHIAVGEILRVELSGENCDPSTARITLSNPAAAQNGDQLTMLENRCNMRLLQAGELTVTAICEGIEASYTVTVLPKNAEYDYSDTLIRYLGRTVAQNGAQVFRNTASGYEVTFYGKKLTAKMPNLSGTTVMSVFVDDETDPKANKIYLGGGEVVLAEFDRAGVHTVRVQKITEESISVGSLASLMVEGGGLIATEAKESLKIVAYGDSITCGYGNMRPDAAVDGLSADTQNGLMTYAAIAARELGAEYEAFSRSGIGLYTNAHNMPYNMKDVYDYISPMSDGSQRWDLSADKPDIVIINLGTNDLGATENKADNIPDGFPFYSHDGMRDAYVEFVQSLNEAYGEGVVYFLVGGMMTSGTNTAMQGAVAILTEAGINAHTVDLPARTGYGGHPTVDVHQAAAAVLAEEIEKVMLG